MLYFDRTWCLLWEILWSWCVDMSVEKSEKSGIYHPLFFVFVFFFFLLTKLNPRHFYIRENPTHFVATLILMFGLFLKVQKEVTSTRIKLVWETLWTFLIRSIEIKNLAIPFTLCWIFFFFFCHLWCFFFVVVRRMFCVISIGETLGRLFSKLLNSRWPSPDSRMVYELDKTLWLSQLS